MAVLNPPHSVTGARIDAIVEQFDGVDAALRDIRDKVLEGRFADARALVDVLAKLLDGEAVPRCAECRVPLLDADLDRYGTWCDDCVGPLEVA